MASTVGTRLSRPVQLPAVTGPWRSLAPRRAGAKEVSRQPEPAARVHAVYPGLSKVHNGMEGIVTRRPIAVKASSSSSAAEGNNSLAPVLFAVAVACCGAFAFGYHLGVVNGPLETIAADLGFAGNTKLSGYVVTSTLIGAAVGSLGGAGLADGLGRKKSFLLCALPMIAGPVLSALATSLNQMLAGRFLAGISIGLSSALVPLYISEVAPASIRGALGSLNQLMICVGILGALVINVALPVTQWSTMFFVAAIPGVLLLLGMLFAPESPRWLASKGDTLAANKAAMQLWGPSGPDQLQMTTGGGGQMASQGKEAGWGDVFAPGLRKGILIACTLFLFQQFSGINAIVYFSTSVFLQAGIASGTLASAAVGATNVLGTLLATGLIEKAGRKQLLGQSYLGMAVAMIAMAAGFGLPALKEVSGTIALVGTLVYILSFAIGAGPVTGLIAPELNSARVRGKAVSLAFVTHWVCNVLVGQNFLPAVNSYGLASVYLFFGLCSLVGLVYVNQAVPETKGKTLEQIEEDMAK